LLNRRTQLSIYIVGAMLVGDFVLFGYWPSRQRLETLQEARARQQSLVRRADCHRRQLTALRGRLAECDRTLAQYEDRIPSPPEMGTFLQEVSDLMARHGLEEQVVIPGPEIEVDGLSCVPMAVRCKGLLADLFAFFREIPSIRRLVQLESIRFTNDTAFSGHVQMDAQIVIFYRPQERPTKGATPAEASI
jgi:Tfp pilus assembly protein PilO